MLYILPVFVYYFVEKLIIKSSPSVQFYFIDSASVLEIFIFDKVRVVWFTMIVSHRIKSRWRKGPMKL